MNEEEVCLNLLNRALEANSLEYAEICYKRYRDLLDTTPYQHAAEERRGDKDFALAAVFKRGADLQYAPTELRNDKGIVLMACSQDSNALEFATQELQNDKEVVLMACHRHASALQYASQALRNDGEFVLMACSGWLHGAALEHASQNLRNDKELVLKACYYDGRALEFASDSLRADKEVVMAAVESRPESLKFALGGLNQDKECLIKAKLWDDEYDDRRRINMQSPPALASKRKIVLSTKFSLAAQSSSHATRFTVELKNHPYIASGNFLVYSPNAFNKGTCDPQWTDINWLCRGTRSTCQKPLHLKVGLPQEAECCWRYSFRYHLEEASRSGGFMIQVIDFKTMDEEAWTSALQGDLFENYAVGDGQTIEREMAQEVGIKTFRFFEPLHSYGRQVDQLVSQIQKWYRNGCTNMSECGVLAGPTAVDRTIIL